MGRKVFWFFIALAIMPVKNTEIPNLDPVQDQIILYKQRTEGYSFNMTTSNGAPVEDRDTATLNSRLLHNSYFMEATTHMIREKIPERTVHGKGSGAFGYFEVTHNVTQYIKADFLSEIGKRTPVAVRFSPAVIERGASDSTRGPRGFAIKFYTAEGNFDIPGFSTPVFAFKDPILFPSFAHSVRKNPATNVLDPNMQWDFITKYPESTNLFLRIFGDDGIPKGYRHMNGYSIHTFQVHNKYGQVYFVRFIFVPDAGKASLTAEEGTKLDGSDPDSFNRDLYEAIACGKQVSWTVGIQIVTQEQAANSKIDIFDVTLDLPLEDFPVTPVGRFFLNRNPLNYFAEIEHLAFCPCNLVPGIDGGLDKMFEARRMAYRDSHLYRLGANFNRIEVNCPFQTTARIYDRDGSPPVGDNEQDSPNYYVNSFNGPTSYTDNNRPKLMEIVEAKANNLSQVGDYYRKLTDEEKSRLIEIVVGSLGSTAQFLQDRAVDMFSQIDSDLSNRVSLGLQDSQRQQACTTAFP